MRNYQVEKLLNSLGSGTALLKQYVVDRADANASCGSEGPWDKHGLCVAHKPMFTMHGVGWQWTGFPDFMLPKMICATKGSHVFISTWPYYPLHPSVRPVSPHGFTTASPLGPPMGHLGFTY